MDGILSDFEVENNGPTGTFCMISTLQGMDGILCDFELENNGPRGTGNFAWFAPVWNILHDLDGIFCDFEMENNGPRGTGSVILHDFSHMWNTLCMICSHAEHF